VSKKEKLIARLMSEPADFTFGEAVTAARYYGYILRNAGRTSGSLVEFVDASGDVFKMHKPHPGNILKAYQIRNFANKLKEKNNGQ